MARCLADIRTQLQDASDLFANRYGKDSRVAERAAEAVISVTSLERELLFEWETGSVRTQVESIGTTA